MKNHIVNLIKLLLGWPLSLLAIFFIGKIVVSNISQIFSAFSHVQIILLILGILALLLYFLFRAIFWYVLLQTHKHHFSFIRATFYWSFSELRRYIPGNVWSFLSRAHYFTTEELTQKDILTLHLTETFFLLVSAGGLSLLSLQFLLNKIAIPAQPFLFPGILAILLFLLLFALFGKSLPFFPKRIQNLLLLLPIQKRFQLFMLMTGAWVCFGLGTYWTIAAVWYIPLQQILSFIGFFAFAFLVGYLSFITPMGLGVREGIMTGGLASSIGYAASAGASLWSRIFLIFAEILFLGISYGALFYEKKTTSVIHWIGKHKHICIVILSMLLYSAYFTTASFLRYHNFYTGRFDLGNMDQTVWNTLHGRIFQLTNPDGTMITSRLTVHADFILVLLAPFYVLWQDPRMLLLIQTIVLALGALFVYFLGKDILGNKRLATIFAVSYLLTPALGYTNLYDFHPVVLATTCLLGAFYFVRKQHYWLFFLFGILAGLTKEEIWATVGLFGLYITFVQKKWWLGVPLLVAGFSLSYTLIAVIIPHVKGSEHFALSFYSDFGDSPTSIVKTIIFSPQKTITTILQPNKLYYLLQLFLPLGFLSLINPLMLFFALPDLTINLLSNNQQFSQIYYQYTSAVTPFICIAALYGVKTLHKWYPKISLSSLGYYVIGSAVISAYLFGPLAGSLHPSIDMFTQEVPYAATISSYLMTIPKSYSVAASNNIGSHLSHRQKIYTIPTGIDQADVIAFLLNDPFAQPSLTAQKQMVADLQRDPRYNKVFSVGDFIVFEKKTLLKQ